MRSAVSVRTFSSVFFVSIRKIISGVLFLLISLSLWTVIGFPIPQQFQLSTAKEEEDAGCENTAGDPQVAVLAQLGLSRHLR